MIDDPDQVERLVARMKESLPLFATVSYEVAAVISEQSRAADPQRRYPITRVDYAGDEGGIVCKVQLGPENDDKALFASITHLRFGRAEPIGRQIAAYQKHRIKRLRRISYESQDGQELTR
jgi:predicted lipoprotein